MDPTPADHLPVAAQFSGTQVNQLVSFDDPADRCLGNIYSLILTTTTTDRIMMPWAKFQVIQGYGVTTYPGGSPPAGYSSLILPAPVFDYTIPTILGGYAGVDYPSCTQGEALFYGMDFSPGLSPGETITSATSYLGLFAGTDTAVLNDPHVYDSGAMTIEGPIVKRKLVWPGGSTLTANVYVLQLTAVTDANQSLSAKARINVALPL